MFVPVACAVPVAADEARPARTVAVADGASRTHRKLNHCGVHDQSSTLS